MFLYFYTTVLLVFVTCAKSTLPEDPALNVPSIPQTEIQNVDSLSSQGLDFKL